MFMPNSGASHSATTFGDAASSDDSTKSRYGSRNAVIHRDPQTGDWLKGASALSNSS
jgi:hypothetical protein